MKYMRNKQKIKQESEQEQILTSSQSKQVKLNNQTSNRLKRRKITLIVAVFMSLLFSYLFFYKIRNQTEESKKQIKSEEVLEMIQSQVKKQGHQENNPQEKQVRPTQKIQQKAVDVQTNLAEYQKQKDLVKDQAQKLDYRQSAQIKEHKFLFIRHGESGFNKGWESLDEKKASYVQYKQIRYTLKLLDVSITQKGINQAEQAKKVLREQLQNETIGVVLVSPLRRALQTCNIIFGERRNIKVIVQPLLGQLMHASCDIGGRISQSYEIYGSKFDFSKIPQQRITDNSWFIDLIKNERLKNLIYEKKEREKLSFSQAAIELLKTQTLETTKQQRQRAKMLKEVLRDLVKKEKKKIALVGHGGIFGLLTADQFDPNNRPLVERQFKNSFPQQIIISFDKF